MAREVVAMDVRMRAAVTDSKTINVSAFCVEHGISRETFYKWRRRYLTGGIDALEPMSRAPKTSPRTMSPVVVEAVIRLRKELDELTGDSGPSTIRYHLAQQGVKPLPSESTIWRILVRGGFIVPAPQKRPKSSVCRFEASAPNELWQTDVTDWPIDTGQVAKILTFLDDHSRIVVSSRVLAEATTIATWETFCQASQAWGLPLGQLSDNGVNFSGKLRGFEVVFEKNLRLAGVKPITSRPYHPQTCGKIERWHQTLKKWLRRQPLAESLEELQAQLDEFVAYYNNVRPHRGIGRITPIERWNQTPPAINLATAIEGPAQRSDGTVNNGCANIDHARCRIHLGSEYEGQPFSVYHDDTHAAVYINGLLIRALTIDTTRIYQPSGRPRVRHHN
jgi:transposase InsO family protein